MSTLSSLFRTAYPSEYEKRPLAKPLDTVPPGTVILFSSNKPTLIQWLIEKVSYARVCHAGTYWGSGGHQTIEAESHGVVIDTLDNRVDDKTMLWLWRYKPLTLDSLAAMKAFAFKEIGTPYDYLAIAELALGGGHPDKSKSICSGSVVRIYAAAGIKVSDKDPDRTSPQDLDRWFRSRPDEWELFDTQNVRT